MATQHDSGAGGNLKKSNVRRGTVFAKLGQQLPFEDEQPTTRRLRFGSRSHGATVGALLGEGMSRELEKASKQVGGDGAGRKDDVDIELLLAGADRLCTI